MKSLAIWVQATRPKTLVVTVCSVLLGLVLSLSDGFFEPTLFIFTLTCALLIQIGTNLANDYFDFLKGADNENRKGPTRVTASGLVSLKQMKIAVAIAFSLAFLSGIYLIWAGGAPIVILLVVSILLGILYTYGPFSLAYLGLGDLAVFIFFGPIAVAGTVFLQTQALSLDALIVGIGPGALSTAVLTINNLRDVEEDRAANKKTLAVRFGKLFVKWEFTALIACAAVIPVFYFDTHPFCLISWAFLLPAGLLIRDVFKNRNPLELNKIFFKTPRLLFIYTFLFAMGWML